jgi:hypothetical protein
MSDLPELLPCPFCGAEGVRPFGSSLVGCKTSGCALNLHLIEERLWSRRADLSAPVGFSREQMRNMTEEERIAYLKNLKEIFVPTGATLTPAAQPVTVGYSRDQIREAVKKAISDVSSFEVPIDRVLATTTADFIAMRVMDAIKKLPCKGADSQESASKNASVAYRDGTEESTAAKDPEDWKRVAHVFGERLGRTGPEGYYAMTANQWFSWAIVELGHLRYQVDQKPAAKGPAILVKALEDIAVDDGVDETSQKIAREALAAYRGGRDE